eukprot:TRINITY_DN121088_c0_g1_i1.p1 TRINITY_DN121088_c0_g1~~TRINITY_DN121088_c0_g1_i1.p1  ORF type:complete len:410 (-),score=122.16 TRINITY_DN121088_c0_g1_i1:52-1281(-)
MAARSIVYADIRRVAGGRAAVWLPSQRHHVAVAGQLATCRHAKASTPSFGLSLNPAHLRQSQRWLSDEASSKDDAKDKDEAAPKKDEAKEEEASSEAAAGEAKPDADAANSEEGSGEDAEGLDVDAASASEDAAEASANGKASPKQHYWEADPLQRLPAAWRDPGEWVDLELERAGLDADARPDVDASTALESHWGNDEFEQPDMNVLWPHPALHEHRSRPFGLPRRLTTGDTRQAAAGKKKKGAGGLSPEEEKQAMLKQLEENRTRLSSLWKYSGSHGISWDELDHAYVSFAKSGKKRYDDWAKSGDLGVTAVHEKHQANEKAKAYLRRFCPTDEETNRKIDPEKFCPGRLRTLQSRIYRNRKKEWLAPFRPGRLTYHLQQLVAARMLRRETEERAYRVVDDAEARRR